jgi:hypothetical protein
MRHAAMIDELSTLIFAAAIKARHTQLCSMNY